MILNKKGLVVLPLAALLFSSCSPWKGVDYEAAKKFINENYTIDGAKPLLPTKVHEKFNATAADAASVANALPLEVLYFYSTKTMLSLPWTKQAPFKCDYENDYVPSEQELSDPKLFPIKSEGESGNPIDTLIAPGSGYTASYQTNGKKFRQNLSGQDSVFKLNENVTYNDKGYRLEITGNCSANGQVDDPTSGNKITINFNFTFSATYTYAK